MCCRYLLLKEHLREILARLGVAGDAAFVTRYNLAPGSAIPAVRAKPHSPGREATTLLWGLVPAWAKNAGSATQLVNARAATLADKPSFRDAFRHRRCLIPASGFYEWAQHGRVRLPWLFQHRDETPFALAALWETWRAPDGQVLESCAVVTTVPGALMRPVHHRQPLVLEPENFAAWLDPDTIQPEKLAPLLRPFSDETLTARRVSRHVSNVHHEDPECLAPAGPDDDGEAGGPQLALEF